MSMSKRVCSVAVPRRDVTRKHALHVSADFLGLHVLGDLPIFARSHVEKHLSECGTCRNQFRRVAREIAVFRAEVCTATT
jgi:predicted anti-sigma-YlaC factor YlaD